MPMVIHNYKSKVLTLTSSYNTTTAPYISLDGALDVLNNNNVNRFFG